MMQPDLKRILESTLSSLGVKRRLKEMMAVLAWPAAVGPELAGRTSARYCQGGILFVGTAGSAWSQQLALLKPTLIEKLNAQLGERIVTDIRFSVGLQAADEAAATSGVRRSPLPDAAVLREAEDAAASLPPDLREAFLRVARAQSCTAATRRAQAPNVCRACGQPIGSAGDLCPVCRSVDSNNRRLQVRAALAQNPALPWTAAADLIPGLLPREYRSEHDDLLTDLWNTYIRTRDSGDPEATRRAAITYLSCKYSLPPTALPEEKIAALARLPVNRRSTNE